MHTFVKILLTAFISLVFISYSHAKEKNSDKGILPLEDLQVFSEVFSLIRNQYVEHVSDSQLFEGAIRGMLQQLDSHSTYLNKSQLNQLIDLTQGSFFGIGVELDKADEILTIVDIIPGSPAEESGLKQGDAVLKINGKPTDNLSLEDSAQLIKGAKNTRVKLTVLSLNEEKIHIVSIKRKQVKLPNITSSIVDKHYAYLKITSFQDTTVGELRKKLQQLQGQPIHGIILDLRNNPGGLLTAAIDTVDLFIRKGLIVYTQGRDENSRQEYHATIGDISNDKRMAVLINSRSASAAEIVAGSLKDHKRATIVGTTSFGKGSVQTVLPVTNDRAIKLTTNLYYTPSGNQINIAGIKPNIVVENKFLPSNDANESETLLNDLQLAAAVNLMKDYKQNREQEAKSFLEFIE